MYWYFIQSSTDSFIFQIKFVYIFYLLSSGGECTHARPKNLKSEETCASWFFYP